MLNSFVMSVGQKKSEFPMRIRTPASSDFAGRTLYQVSYRELIGELSHFLGSYVTSVLHTARVSNVESVLCGDRVRKMVNFEFGR